LSVVTEGVGGEAVTTTVGWITTVGWLGTTSITTVVVCTGAAGELL